MFAGTGQARRVAPVGRISGNIEGLRQFLSFQYQPAAVLFLEFYQSTGQYLLASACFLPSGILLLMEGFRASNM